MARLVLAGALALAAACDGARTEHAAGPTTGGAQGLVFLDGLLDSPAARPYFHDFGERLHGERIEHVWRLENREKRAILVRDLLPDCGCTQPRATVVLASGERVQGPARTRDLGLALPAGAVLEVAIALDTTRVERPNEDKLAQVRLRCDSLVTPYLTFEMHVVVVRSFRSVPPEVVLVDVPQGVGKTARADLTVVVPGHGARLLGIDSVEGPFTAELAETTLGAETLWVLTVAADAGLPLGPHAGTVIVRTTRPDGEGLGAPFRVPVRAQVVTDCVLEPRVLVLPPPGVPPLACELVALAPGARVLVKHAAVEGAAAGKVRVTWSAVDPDAAGRAARWHLTIETTAPVPIGASRLAIELDHDLLPRLEWPLSVR